MKELEIYIRVMNMKDKGQMFHKYCSSIILNNEKNVFFPFFKTNLMNSYTFEYTFEM